MIRTLIGTVIGILAAIVVLQKYQQATHEKSMSKYEDAAALNSAFADIQTIKFIIEYHLEKAETLPCSVKDLPSSLRIKGKPLTDTLLLPRVPDCGVIEFPLIQPINGREPVIRYQLSLERIANRSVFNWQCEVNVKPDIVEAQIPCEYLDPMTVDEQLILEP